MNRRGFFAGLCALIPISFFSKKENKQDIPITYRGGSSSTCSHCGSNFGDWNELYVYCTESNVTVDMDNDGVVSWEGTFVGREKHGTKVQFVPGEMYKIIPANRTKV